MFDFLFSARDTSDKEPLPKRRLPPDPVVDISHLYGITVRKECICEGYFTTCRSHREVMLKQEIVFAKLFTEDAFAPFIANPKRTIALPIHRKIKEFVLNGIPPRFRSAMWQSMIGLSTRRFTSYPYAELFEKKKNEDIVAQIALDVTRTVPAVEDMMYIERMTRVLTAYSVRNPQLGYCQSMNFLAGTLLLFMEEESAFWMLVYMVEELLPSYYIPSMSGFHVDANTFEWLISDNLPDLYNHFCKVHLSCKILTSPWFLCLFVNDFPPETAFLVWDNLMFEGIVVLFEVGLAVLHLLQPELLKFKCQVELTQHIRKRTLEIHDPTILLKHWPRLDKARTLAIRRVMRQKEEEETMKNIITKQFSKLQFCTRFELKDLMTLWKQYIAIDPCLAGFNFELFAQFVGGTFSEWWVDEELVKRLFLLADVGQDGVVDFGELSVLLSVMCRGFRKDVVNFNFQLFDSKDKGWIDSFDLSRMLQSIYAMFKNGSDFQKQLHTIVEEIITKYAKMGNIYIDDFEHVVLMQPQIMERFKRKYPTTSFSLRTTFYYWMFEPERPNKTLEIISFSLDPKALLKQSQVSLPVMFL